MHSPFNLVDLLLGTETLLRVILEITTKDSPIRDQIPQETGSETGISVQGQLSWEQNL